MASISPRALIEKLNPTCRRGLENSAGLCLARTHFHVEIEHWLLQLLDSTQNDLAILCKHYGIHQDKVRQELDTELAQFKTGNGRAPDLSREIPSLIQEAWMIGSLELGGNRVRTSHLVIALLSDQMLALRMRKSSPELSRLSVEKLLAELPDLLAATTSEENERAPAQMGGASAAPPTGSAAGTKALDQFTTNLTELAAQGRIDPVVGRDAEIWKIVDILTRRRQNNPILTGEAGVGKTAVVEGLALRIAQGDVPDPLKQVVIRVLDLGLLQAGAGVKGEFENRLKSVIDEVKKSPQPVILFIDEAHTLIGAGGAAGQGDAANLLKPALARGELRTIAATTFAEYKKFFETDAALKRRFQQVRVDEPDEAKAVRMLRGLLPTLEKHHWVRILDSALVEAVRLTSRYIPDRQLPDKAVSLLDTACARVALSQSATPQPVESLQREIEHLGTEIRALEREGLTSPEHDERLAALRQRLDSTEAAAAQLRSRLEQEKVLVSQIQSLREQLETGEAQGDREALLKLQAELKQLQGEQALIFPVVDGEVVAEVVAAWTGIPVGKMVRDEIHAILSLQEHLAERIIGQQYALESLAQRIRTSRAGLSDPRRPIGVFLMVGPSGVGKTETAISLANLLYGGDRNMITVNMSEYKEEYKVSQLIGSPRGYEGSQEGGVLTEAVRRRPYSIVLLDEVEKAHPSVQEIFYQVFDKGVLTDSRGIEVDFKNTIILLTSNVGTETIMKLAADPETMPDATGMAEALRPELLKSFKPALLGRMTVVPYFPLSEAVLKQVIELQLSKIRDRLAMNHQVEFWYDPEVIELIARRCKEVESGARNVDHILTGTLLPAISSEILSGLAQGRRIYSIRVGVDGSANFVYDFA